MKTIFNLLIIHFLLSLTFSATSAERGFNIASDQKNFLPLDGMNLGVFGLTLDPLIFGDLKKERNDLDRIIKVPISVLAPIGIHEKTTVQSVFIDKWDETVAPPNSTYMKYQFEKSFYSYLKSKEDTEPNDKHPEAGETWYNHFSIFLGNEQFSRKISNDDKRSSFLPVNDTVSGIAYIGEGRTLQASKATAISFDLVPKDDPIYKKYLGKEVKKGEWLKSASFYEHKIFLKKNVYVENESTRKSELAGGRAVEGYVAFIVSKTGENEVIASTHAEDNDELQKLYSYDWFPNSKSILVIDSIPDSWPQCASLIIISNPKIEKVRLPCRKEIHYKGRKSN